jgi:hypothetical protein
MSNLGYYTARNFIIHLVVLGCLKHEIIGGRMGWTCRNDGEGGKECIQNISEHRKRNQLAGRQRKLSVKITFSLIS